LYFKKKRTISQAVVEATHTTQDLYVFHESLFTKHKQHRISKKKKVAPNARHDVERQRDAHSRDRCVGNLLWATHTHELRSFKKVIVAKNHKSTIKDYSDGRC
jgi:hypothetical protein